MREVTVAVEAAGRTAEEAYGLISDFARYPELTDTVTGVTVHPPDADGTVLSDWSVVFRSGQMRWSERDTFLPEKLTVRFEQLEGDFEVFRGEWVCEGHGPGTIVRFSASFDLGIPSLAEILDPVAESTLRDNIIRILGGLLGEVTEVELAVRGHG